MRYRREVNGDYTFGLGTANFLVNSPEAVGQAVVTKLRLFAGEVFYNTSLGMTWDTDVLGFSSKANYDDVIQAQILATEGVASIVSYSSVLNTQRELTITCRIDTIYSGQTTFATTLAATGYGVGPFADNPYGV